MLRLQYQIVKDYIIHSEYGDMHRAILQTVMGHGTIHKNALKDVFVILSQESKVNFHLTFCY